MIYNLYMAKAMTTTFQFQETGWVEDGGYWYHLRASGRMDTGWTKLSGTWYHLRDSGRMDTGWVKTGGVWYCYQLHAGKADISFRRRKAREAYLIGREKGLIDDYGDPVNPTASARAQAACASVQAGTASKASR